MKAGRGAIGEQAQNAVEAEQAEQAEKAAKARQRARWAAMIGLVVVGIALLGYGAVLWWVPDPARVSDVTKTSTTEVAKPPNEATQGGTTTTRVSSTDTSSPAPASRRSETVVLAVLGLGSLLLLCGMLFDRLQKVTFPGGGSVELAVQETLVEKVVAKAKADPTIDDPQTIAKLYRAAAEDLSGKWGIQSDRTDIPPSDVRLEMTVDRVVAREKRDSPRRSGTSG